MFGKKNGPERDDAAKSAADETEGVTAGAPDPEVSPQGEEAESGGASEVASSSRKSSPVKLVAAGLAGVVFVAAVVIAVLASWNWKKLHDEQENGQAASAQACEYAKKLATYDFNNLDAFFQAIMTGVTGEAKQRFEETSKSEDLKNFLKQAQVKSQVDGTECGVKSVDGDSVEVVISITGRQGSLGTQGQLVPRQIGVLATMQKEDGEWLVSKLDAPFLQQ